MSAHVNDWHPLAGDGGAMHANKKKVSSYNTKAATLSSERDISLETLLGEMSYLKV